MILIQKKAENHEELLWTPKEADDIAMFVHCSGGLIAVTPDFLEQRVFPVLLNHNIEVVFEK